MKTLRERLHFLFIILYCFASINCSIENTRANEGITVKTLFTIRKLQAIYAAKHQGKFAASFDELIKSENLDEHFSENEPVINGYRYELKVTEPTGAKPAFYSVTASPQISEGFYATGTYYFYIDSTIETTKVAENRQANADDPSL